MRATLLHDSRNMKPPNSVG